MERISLTAARAHLSELVERAAAGDAVCITRRGKSMAQIAPLEKPKKRIDLAMLRALTDGEPRQPESAGRFMRRMRDQARY